MFQLKRNKNTILIILGLFLLCSPAVFSLLKPGFFLTDDGNWMIIRFSSFYQEFVSGQIPTRFLGRLNNEFGYPVANFLYPGFMYLGVPIHILGFGFVDTIKIILFSSMLGSGLFMYAWLKKFFNEISSIFGALVYVYAPYHLYDLYVRGSVGEILSLAIFPFILWQYERKSLLWTSIGVGFLLISHNTLAVLFLTFFLGYCFLSIFTSSEKNKFNWLNFSVLTLGFGVAISSFFWLPALFDLQYTVFFNTNVSDWRKYFATWNLIGFSSLFLLTTLWFIVKKKVSFTKHRLTLFIFVVGVVSLFLSFSQSTFVWNILPVSFIQFPFRFLSVTILCLAFLAAFFLSQLSKKHALMTFIVLMILVLYSAIPFLAPSSFSQNEEGFYSTNMDTTTVKNEYMPKWVELLPSDKAETLIVGNGQVSNVFQKGSAISFSYTDSESRKVVINKLYFPGWNVDVNGVSIPISYENKTGRLQFELPEGSSNVEIFFRETPVRIFADVVSIMSLLLLIIISIKIRRKHAIS